MKNIDPKELPISKRHQYLLGSIGPRPICFASTIDKDGNPNLSPFSFFNVFSANPPIVVFSPARSGRTGKTKDTHENCLEVPEVVINVVNYSIVEQMSLSSSPYPKGVNEFEKSGLTPLKSDKVRPFRVKESPIQLECVVREIRSLGDEGGAGNLIIAEVVQMHFDESILDENEMVDQTKIDLVARMGGNFYCRAHGDALFELPKPLTTIGIGVDALPIAIRNSKHLSGNDLGKLGQLEGFPSDSEVQMARSLPPQDAINEAKQLLKSHDIKQAFCLLKKNVSQVE